MKSSKAVKRLRNIAYIFSVALMIASLMANVLPARIAQATPPEQDLQLNLSHIYCYDGDNPSLEGLVEIHFVLLNVPDGITPGTLTYPYGTIEPGAHTGNVWHYTAYQPSGNYNVTSASVEVDGETVNLANPGVYAGDYDCSTTQNASASVSLGVCTYTAAAGSLTPVTISLTGASLTIAGATYTSSTTINLSPGIYPYTWSALSGHTGSGSGSITVSDCTPGTAEATIYTEACTWNEEDGSLTQVVITLTGASFTIDGETYTSSTTIYLPPGFFEYTWTALSGFIGSGSGQIYVGNCTPGNAVASISTGTCTWDDEDGSMTPVLITLTDASLTIDGVTYTSSTTIQLAPGTYPYTWTALDGYTGSGGGDLIIAECIPPSPVPTADLVCYTLEVSAFKVSVGNSGPSGEIGYKSDLDGTITSLGVIANGGSVEIQVPGGAATLSVYAKVGSAWGAPVDLVLDVTRSPVCEKDPMSVEPFCSYVDLDQPHGWTVNNLNPFAVSFTWQYGSLGSPAPIALSAGSSYDFTTPDQPGESMLIFVDGVQLASSEPASCPEFLTLELVGICSNDPASTHGWRANNYNAFEVSAEWRVVGTALTGLLTIPASSAILFTTPVEEGDMAQLYYGGVFQDDAGAARDCVPPENPPETPPGTPPGTPPLVIIPLTAPAAPILIPVTGVADDLGNMAPAGMFSLGLGFFGLGTVLHGVSRKRAREQ